MKTISTYKSILFKFILSLTIATISILQSISIPAVATTTNNYQAKIISKNTFNNSLTVQLNNDLYNFYVNDINNYYLSELITITMDDKHSIIDCSITSEPQVYNNIPVIYADNSVVCVRINNDIYSFDNEDESWQVGDKCKVIIQAGRILEVRPIPLNER